MELLKTTHNMYVNIDPKDTLPTDPTPLNEALNQVAAWGGTWGRTTRPREEEEERARGNEEESDSRP